MAGIRVLDDVRQRLLNDSVEDGLDVLWETIIVKPRLELNLEAGLLGEAGRQSLESGLEPEVVERGRTQLDCEPAHILQGLDDTRAECGDPIAELSNVARLLQRFEAEENRRQCLPGLVVKLAGEAPTLLLLGMDDPPEGVSLDSACLVCGNGCT
jgi:hypothetical protein